MDGPFSDVRKSVEVGSEDLMFESWAPFGGTLF